MTDHLHEIITEAITELKVAGIPGPYRAAVPLAWVADQVDLSTVTTVTYTIPDMQGACEVTVHQVGGAAYVADLAGLGSIDLVDRGNLQLWPSFGFTVRSVDATDLPSWISTTQSRPT